MARALALLIAPGLEALAEPVEAALAGIFPGLDIRRRLTAAPPRQAYDTARGWYDARYLLATALPAAAGRVAGLWLVASALGDGWRPGLLGAAIPGRAVVSTARLRSPADVAKVAAHETGHLLGLAHCRAACLMRIAAEARELDAIPLDLCDACRQRLASRFTMPADDRQPPHERTASWSQ